MSFVDVLLLLPRRLEKAVYIYKVPASMQDGPGFGQRVLVRAAGRRCEGIVLGWTQGAPPERCSEIIKVLDAEAVVLPELLELAEWMAMHYASPLEQVLRGIIPGFLRHRQREMLVPLAAREELPALEPALEALMEQLWEEGSLGLKEARQAVGDAGIQRLEDEGWAGRAQDYGYISGWDRGAAICTAAPGAADAVETLAARAPRQAAFLKQLQAAGSMTEDEARTLAGPRVLKELEKKGLLFIELLQSQIQAEPGFVLSSEQSRALEELRGAIQNGQYGEYLLWGVTGSGKTEIYIQLSLEILAQERGVLLLVPEIALTRQLVAMFSARIGEVAVMHSDMPPRERYGMWNRIRHGQVRMVIGARGAVFAPLENLGLVIIDEEQETSYKQEESPRYHVRDIARRRAAYHGALLLMGSATPSLETFHRAMNGQIGLLELKQRIGAGEEPRIIIDDLRQVKGRLEHTLIAPLLEEKIRQRLAGGEQVILFLNRRGYKPVTLCRACGRSRSCPHCSVSLNYHRDQQASICHYCGYREEPGQCCGFCGSVMIDMAGFGTQTVEEEAGRMFPGARIARLDADSSRHRGQQERVLSAMKSGSLDILVGTQMVAKGFDFPMVSLVGVLGADQMLSLPDFRAGERAYQLIVQAAGRAGRARGGAEVVVQTANPGSDIIKMAVEKDYAAFYLYEIRSRQLLQYPPFTHILRVVASSEVEGLCHRRIADIIKYSGELLDAREEEVTFLGPADCPIYRLRGRYRCQFLVKAVDEELISSLATYLARLPAVDQCRLELDLNPLSLM